MKIILNFAFATFALIVAPSAFAVQYIDCVPTPHDTSDHVIVSLNDDVTGTLYLHSGFGENGENDNSGKLILARVPARDPNQAIFVSENSTSRFVFSFPQGLVQARFMKLFPASLRLSTKDGASAYVTSLQCFTRLY